MLIDGLVGKLDDVVDAIVPGIIRSRVINDLQSADALADAGLVVVDDIALGDRGKIARADAAVIGRNGQNQLRDQRLALLIPSQRIADGAFTACFYRAVNNFRL